MPRRKRRGGAQREKERLIRSLQRALLVVMLIGLIPIGLLFGCGGRTEGPCSVPSDLYLFVTAGVLGAFIGLTIRIVRERRSIERAKR
ncbi:MAG TPA: hypothetical protein VFM93_04735 [Candidatus Limnocylindria bacterium]|nr:hypothetical protein [Candidatus Limnocylindria bacterium]